MRLFHVLRQGRSRSNWMVRTDGVPDVVIRGEQPAVDYARTVCRGLADKWGMPVVLRRWNVFERYVDELFEPAPDPLREPSKRRVA